MKHLSKTLFFSAALSWCFGVSAYLGLANGFNDLITGNIVLVMRLPTNSFLRQQGSISDINSRPLTCNAYVKQCEELPVATVRYHKENRTMHLKVTDDVPAIGMNKTDII